jgi:hypothetical protein
MESSGWEFVEVAKQVPLQAQTVTEGGSSDPYLV